uniref:RNase H type-1 domain-containing protein n=1 Tax=Fagus sylvatica TaxID=28930 RepID=A0A2N9HHY0_FAGSY
MEAIRANPLAFGTKLNVDALWKAGKSCLAVSAKNVYGDALKAWIQHFVINSIEMVEALVGRLAMERAIDVGLLPVIIEADSNR